MPRSRTQLVCGEKCPLWDYLFEGADPDLRYCVLCRSWRKAGDGCRADQDGWCALEHAMMRLGVRLGLCRWAPVGTVGEAWTAVEHGGSRRARGGLAPCGPDDPTQGA